MHPFQFFQASSTCINPIIALLCGAFLSFVLMGPSTVLKAHPNLGMALGLVAFIASTWIIFHGVHSYEQEVAAHKNALALQWLKAPPSLTTIKPDSNAGTVSLEIMPEEQPIVVAGRISKETEPTEKISVELRRDQIDAFNAYVDKNFPSLIASSRSRFETNLVAAGQ